MKSSRLKSNKYGKLSSGNEVDERSASLLELFFDVIIVALLGGAIHGGIFEFEDYLVSGHLNAMNIVYILIQVITVLFLGRNFLFYSSKYENNNLRHRLFTMLLMLSILLMDVASYIDIPSSSTETNYAVMIINFSGLTSSMLITAYLHGSTSGVVDNKYEKQFLVKTAIGRVVNALLVVASFLTYGLVEQIGVRGLAISIGFVMLALGIFSSFTTGTNSYFANSHQTSTKLIQERYSVLIIIFFGELVIQVVSSIAANSSTFDEAMNGVGQLVVTFIMIFAGGGIFRENYNYPEMKNQPNMINLYTYSMIAVFLSLIISTTGISLIFNESEELSYIGKYVLALGVLCGTIFASIVSITLHPYNSEDKGILPKLHRKLVVIVSAVSIPALGIVFIPSISGLYGLIFVICFSAMNVASIEFVQYITSKQQKENTSEYEEYIKLMKPMSDEGINKNIKPVLDRELHLAYKKELNCFSVYVK